MTSYTNVPKCDTLEKSVGPTDIDGMGVFKIIQEFNLWITIFIHFFIVYLMTSVVQPI
jgi:hypothetical protein